MASLYIHIPFCKKACHYCSFYFTLSPKKKQEFISALCKEIEQRKNELAGEVITTIYFGGGTPSLISIEEFHRVFESIYANYTIAPKPEITLESNPENLTEDYLFQLKSLSFNRLSIGVQSFFDEDLAIMNRNHNQNQAILAIQRANTYFENLSVDLIFGLPYSGMSRWKENLQHAVDLNVKHISTYNLTVEEKTALARKVARKELTLERDDTLNEMYLYTIDFLSAQKFIPYEISNFGQKNFWSLHNINYWTQIPYLGFGPSAHSYSGKERSWNVSNLKNYIEAIEQGILCSEKEILSIENKYNEYVLTRLRTIFGVDIHEIKTIFGETFENHFLKKIKEFESRNLVLKENTTYKLSADGKILADYIASELMS